MNAYALDKTGLVCSLTDNERKLIRLKNNKQVKSKHNFKSVIRMGTCPKTGLLIRLK